MTQRSDAETGLPDRPDGDQVEEIYVALRRLRRLYAAWQEGADGAEVPPTLEEVLRKLADSE